MKLIELLENAPLSLMRPYLKLWNKNSNKELFDRYKEYALDRNIYRLAFPLQITTKKFGSDELDIMNSVLTALYELKPTTAYAIQDLTKLEVISFVSDNMKLYSRIGPNENYEIVENYIQGYVHDGKNLIRIGKILSQAIKFYERLLKLNDDFKNRNLIVELLNQFKKALRDFNSDPIRQANFTRGSYYVIISRHPMDIATASHNRGWTSCLNLTDGEKKWILLGDVKKESIIAYLVLEGDWDIRNPKARMLLPKYVNAEKPDEFLFYAHYDSYGSYSEDFHKFLTDFTNEINSESSDGLYCVDDGYFRDLDLKKQGNKIDVV